MKTYKNLYEKIISEENLKKAFYAAAKGKKNRRDVRQILNNIDEHVYILHEILKKEEFRPAHHIPQEINDGFKQKKRRIIKPPAAALAMFLGRTVRVSTMAANTGRHSSTVSMASKMASLSSCMSLL